MAAPRRFGETVVSGSIKLCDRSHAAAAAFSSQYQALRSIIARRRGNATAWPGAGEQSLDDFIKGRGVRSVRRGKFVRCDFMLQRKQTEYWLLSKKSIGSRTHEAVADSGVFCAVRD